MTEPPWTPVAPRTTRIGFVVVMLGICVKYWESGIVSIVSVVTEEMPVLFIFESEN